MESKPLWSRSWGKFPKKKESSYELTEMFIYVLKFISPAPTPRGRGGVRLQKFFLLGITGNIQICREKSYFDLCVEGGQFKIEPLFLCADKDI